MTLLTCCTGSGSHQQQQQRYHLLEAASFGKKSQLGIQIGIGIGLASFGKKSQLGTGIGSGFGLEKEPIADLLQRKQEAAAE